MPKVWGVVYDLETVWERMVEEARKRGEIKGEPGTPTMFPFGRQDELTELLEEKLGFGDEWDTGKLVSTFEGYLKQNNIPHLVKVFENSTDVETMKNELREAANRLNKKFGGRIYDIKAFIVPDMEEDPPDDGSGAGPACVIVAGGLMAFAALLLASRLARRQ